MVLEIMMAKWYSGQIWPKFPDIHFTPEGKTAKKKPQPGNWPNKDLNLSLLDERQWRYSSITTVFQSYNNSCVIVLDDENSKVPPISNSYVLRPCNHCLNCACSALRMKLTHTKENYLNIRSVYTKLNINICCKQV